MHDRVHFLVFILFSLPLLLAAQPLDAADCDESDEPTGRASASTFTVHLPLATEYASDASMVADSLVIPDGRPIYALFVHGYTQNPNFDQFLCYNFAKRLMADGAYVHFAWWNNLCAEYMARPLHQTDSHPGNMDLIGLLDPDLHDKAVPEEDYQFQSDAARFLTAIREHNPSAIIVLIGHSMGGGAVARLATNSDVLIDILAPLDPVENRGSPQGRLPNVAFLLFSPPYPPVVYPDFNYTRWRITHLEFQGYKQHHCLSWNGDDCQDCSGYGDTWYGFFDLPTPHSLPRGWPSNIFNTDDDCGFAWITFPGNPIPMAIWYPYLHSPQQRAFGGNVINLHHRYQKEFFFPFDYDSDLEFAHTPPPGGTSTQQAVETCSNGSDPGGHGDQCWDTDGHGEIVGFRGPTDLVQKSVPMALEAQGDWPTGLQNPDACERRRLIIEMPDADSHDTWRHRPENPDLCLVSQGLIDLYQYMNRPPAADAGGNRIAELTEFGVVLDGSGSTDPDGDLLIHFWQGPFGEMEGQTVTVMLDPGTHEITLTVRDPSGHIDRDVVELTVVDEENHQQTRMLGAHPNPFNLTVRVAFKLAERQPVTLQVFDLQGRLIRNLEERTLDAGPHEVAWNGLSDAGRAVPSGTYMVRMTAGDLITNTKVALIK